MKVVPMGMAVAREDLRCRWFLAVSRGEEDFLRGKEIRAKDSHGPSPLWAIELLTLP